MLSYLQPHDQRQVRVLCRRAVSIIEPPEHVGPFSHFHIVPHLFTSQGTEEPCMGLELLVIYRVREIYTTYTFKVTLLVVSFC